MHSPMPTCPVGTKNAANANRRPASSEKTRGWCASLLKTMLTLGGIWVLGLMWLHVMQAELHAEGQVASQFVNVFGGQGKLAHLRDFAKEFIHSHNLTLTDNINLAHLQRDRVGKEKVAVTGSDDDDDTVLKTLDGEPTIIAEKENTDADTAVSASASVLYHSSPDDVLHILFSTDCSFYQDWQSLVLFHSAHTVGQRGHITRIASGCDAKAQFEMLHLYARLWPKSRTGGWIYSAHFTPDFKKDSSGEKYDFYNKPFGVQHWLKSHPVDGDGASGNTDTGRPPLANANTVVAVVDPDFLFLRALTVAINKEQTNDSNPPAVVGKGAPMGQLYGLGAPWTRAANQNINLRTPKGKPNFFNLQDICGAGSPCLDVQEPEGNLHYAVGPPYVVHISDFGRLVDTWVKFVPRVFKGYPHLLAEMYAYVLAAAHEQLPHTTMSSHMVSNVDVPASAEGWSSIDALGDDVCQPAETMMTVSNAMDVAGAADSVHKLFYPKSDLPIVLHYCQFYRIGVYGFQKRRFHKKIFQCDSPLLADIPLDVGKLRHKEKEKEEIVQFGQQTARRNTFMICAIHHAVNDAVLDVKMRTCHAGGDSAGNVKNVHDITGADLSDVVNSNKTINLALWQ